jgi:hypothetical protein
MATTEMDRAEGKNVAVLGDIVPVREQIRWQARASHRERGSSVQDHAVSQS